MVFPCRRLSAWPMTTLTARYQVGLACFPRCSAEFRRAPVKGESEGAVPRPMLTKCAQIAQWWKRRYPMCRLRMFRGLGMSPAASNSGREEETMALERRCPANIIRRTTIVNQLFRVVGWRTSSVEAVTSRVAWGLDDKKNGCNESRAHQDGIGIHDTVIALGVGTATTAVSESFTATGLQLPTHEMSGGTFARSAETGQESHAQTIRQLGVGEAVVIEIGIGAFVDDFSPAFMYIFREMDGGLDC